MTTPRITLTGKRLRTPRAASVAGILFSILFSTSLALIRFSLDEASSAHGKWTDTGATYMRVALSMMPFAGIAFLWFVGVIRDRLGSFEDQFFSTVFYGSGLLFLAMIFAASAVAGGIDASYSVGLTTTEIYQFGRLIMGQLFTIYALRMAGVFVISLGTIWFRTGLMPRWLTFITYLFALILLLSTSLNIWMVLVFPGWVLIISVYFLILNVRGQTPDVSDGMIMDQAT